MAINRVKVVKKCHDENYFVLILPKSIYYECLDVILCGAFYIFENRLMFFLVGVQIYL